MAEPERLRIEIKAETPAEVRRRRLAEIAARLEAGELDSDLAAIETAMALLDGDISPATKP